MKRYKTMEKLGKDLGISPERVFISKMKTKLKKRIIQEINLKGVTPSELALTSGLSRTVISGIINGSLQSLSLERLIRLAGALNLSVDLKIQDAA